MPDYKEMYLTLMRETEKAIRTLTEAQRACEELLGGLLLGFALVALYLAALRALRLPV